MPIQNVTPESTDDQRIDITGPAKLYKVFELAASTIGLDPSDPKVSEVIDRQAQSVMKNNPGKTTDEWVNIVKQDVPKLISTFLQPTANQDVNLREQQDLARQRDTLSKQVERRADVARDFAPFNTNVRDTINGGQGKYAADYVNREYAPLQAFDAQTKAMKEGRTADLEATGKVFTNQQEQAKAQEGRTTAVGKNIDVFNKQLDNDPTSKVSQISADIARRFLKKFDLPDIPQLDGATKVQVDTIMGDVIKSALANAKTETDRRNIMAMISQVDAQTDKVIQEARTAAVDAYIAEQVGAGRGMPLPTPRTATPQPGQRVSPAGAPPLPGRAGGTAPAGTATPAAGGQKPSTAAATAPAAGTAAGQAAAPAAAASAPGAPPALPNSYLQKYGTPTEIAEQKQQGESNTGFQNAARSRDKLKVAIGDARKLLDEGTRTGPIAGPLGLKVNTQVQSLAKSLATVLEENGAGAADTNYKALLSASTGADVTKNVATIRKILDNVESQTLKDEYIGQKRIEMQGKPFNEALLRNSLVTIKLTDPTTKKVQIQVIDMNTTSRQELEAFREKYKAYKPEPVGGR